MRVIAVCLVACMLGVSNAQLDDYIAKGCLTSNRVVNCEGLQLTELPADIPDTFTKLLAKDNIINDNTGTELVRCNGDSNPCGSGVLTAAQVANVAGHVGLEEIQLQSNGILNIATGTFGSGFGNILILRVFGNSIVEIQNGAFDGLTSLETLFINNNPTLTAIRAGAFDPFAGSLTELFSKDNGMLTVVEDGSVNGITNRPLSIDMSSNPSICATSPFDIIECACAPGLIGGSSGFCEESDAPTTSPTLSPTPNPTRAPTRNPTPNPTPAPSRAPTGSPTVTVAPDAVTTTADAIDRVDGGDGDEAGKSAKGKKGMSGDEEDGEAKLPDEPDADDMGKSAKGAKSAKAAKSGQDDGEARVDSTGSPDATGEAREDEDDGKSPKAKKGKSDDADAEDRVSGDSGSAVDRVDGDGDDGKSGKKGKSDDEATDQPRLDGDDGKSVKSAKSKKGDSEEDTDDAGQDRVSGDSGSGALDRVDDTTASPGKSKKKQKGESLRWTVSAQPIGDLKSNVKLFPASVVAAVVGVALVVGAAVAVARRRLVEYAPLSTKEPSDESSETTPMISGGVGGNAYNTVAPQLE